MGYASYMTALGPAGYGHADTCHTSDCDAEIDRGLAYLCGPEPGSPGEVGCGRWFCADHLYMAGSDEIADRVGIGGGLCLPCLESAASEQEDEPTAPASVPTPERTEQP